MGSSGVDANAEWTWIRDEGRRHLQFRHHYLGTSEQTTGLCEQHSRRLRRIPVRSGSDITFLTPTINNSPINTIKIFFLHKWHKYRMAKKKLATPTRAVTVRWRGQFLAHAAQCLISEAICKLCLIQSTGSLSAAWSIHEKMFWRLCFSLGVDGCRILYSHAAQFQMW